MFVLDPRLAADTAPVADWPLSALRLMNDRRFPWLILVPRRPSLREIFDLQGGDRAGLLAEIAAAAEILSAATGAQKMNVAALGNRVAQLHIHVIARFRSDAAWPNPVWGRGEREPYDAEALAARAAEWAESFKNPPA